MTQAHGNCLLRIMGSCMVATVWYFASTSDAMLLHFRCALISGYPSHSDSQHENRSKSHVQPFDRYCYARKKLVDRQAKLSNWRLQNQVFHEATTAIIFPCLWGVSLQLLFLDFGVTNCTLCFDMVRNSGYCKYSFKIELHEILGKVVGKNQKKRTFKDFSKTQWELVKKFIFLQTSCQ